MDAGSKTISLRCCRRWNGRSEYSPLPLGEGLGGEGLDASQSLTPALSQREREITNTFPVISFRIPNQLIV